MSQTPKEYKELEDDLKSMKDQLDAVISKLSKINTCCPTSEYTLENFPNELNRTFSVYSGNNDNQQRNVHHQQLKSPNRPTDITIDFNSPQNNLQTHQISRNLVSSSYLSPVLTRSEYMSQISLPNSVGKSEELINSILDLTEMDHIIDRIEKESNCSEVSDVESLDNIPEFTQCPFSRYTSESDLTIYNDDDVDVDDTDSVSNMLTPSFCSLPNKSILSLSTHSLQNIDKQEELENQTIENRKLSNYLDVETNEHNLNTFWTKNNKNNPKLILERCLASNSAVSFTSSENMVQNNDNYNK